MSKLRRVSMIWWVIWIGVIVQPAALTVLSLVTGNGYFWAFAGITAVWVGMLVVWVWAQDDAAVPIPVRPKPSLIFRFVKRDERATYVRIMRRTLAVQMRDLNRQTERAVRQIGKALLPVMLRVVDSLNAVFKR